MGVAITVPAGLIGGAFQIVGATGAGGGYSAEALQFFARITDPGTTRKNAYAAIIDALVAGGVWSKLDALWIYASDIQANGLVNLKSSSFTTTVQGGLSFTTDQGFSSGATIDFLDTTFNASTAGGSYTQNGACLGLWNRSTTTSSNVNALMGNEPTAAGESHLFPAYSGTDFYGRVNANVDSASFGTVPARDGFFHANRSSSSATQGYRNGSQVGSGVTSTSAALINASFFVCKCRGGSSANDQIAVAFLGGSLNSTEAGAFYSALNTNKWW